MCPSPLMYLTCRLLYVVRLNTNSFDTRPSQLEHTTEIMSATAVHRPLAGKTAIVTGASRGIGAGIALELAQKGANVVVNYVSNGSRQAAADVVSKIEATGSKAVLCQASISVLDDIPKLVKTAVDFSVTGKIEILVHNAALGEDAFLKDVSLDFYNRHVDCNLRGPFFLTQQILPHLPQGGRIVLVSSVAARLGVPMQSIYSATKAGNEALARVWAKELGQEYGVTVNCVNPGPVATDQWRNSNEDFLKEMQPIIDSTPAAARVGEVEDIAPLVAFLCSEEARWVT
ncbi:unnamed protein product [Penicillium salamii]|uniref:Ketoreductase domain-containing protein n=1 Tax=Penicillium salamii TaxID=1612424 RepID=A0A9W4J3D8_9EURO|nr:unnamed protein product [Penicillium salamii]CAG8021495.1 unnamed protein product [Penicillium salamii]CAG8120288.1 unnamed protein product [Penicillium salamii]CAG8146029.1 unnamed protein product [Penicillium salamii]CAG8334776.1 unnamed protein product [Penicillium salamii]